MECTANLVDDACITVRVGEDEHEATLAQVLANLGARLDVVLCHAQAYQDHAIYAFLVNIAIQGLHLAGEASPALPAEAWRKILLSLAPLSAYDLVEPDLSKSAFMQSPTDEDIIDPEKPERRMLTPDEVDTIPSGANHSLKKRRITNARAEHLFFALMSLQGSSNAIAGYRGSPRVTRKGRICVTIAPSLSLGARFVRDVKIGLDPERRKLLVRDYHYRREGGIGLVWLEPWDGKTSLPADRLDPFFLDVPRLVRLRAEDGKIVGYRRETNAPRVTVAGSGGDLWTPHTTKKDKIVALGLGGAVLHALSLTTNYERIHEFLFDSNRPESAKVDFEGDGVLIVSGMVRDNGKTQGYHERFIPFSEKHAADFKEESAESRLALSSSGMIDEVSKLRDVLGKAIWSLMLGRERTTDGMRGRHEGQHDKLMSLFETRVDDSFFDHLFRFAESEDILPWFELLMAAARDTIEQAASTSTHNAGSYYAGLSAAARMLDAHEQARRKNIRPNEETSMTQPHPSNHYDTLHEVVTRVHNYISAVKRKDRGSYAALRDLDPLAPSGRDYFEIEAKYIDGAELPRASKSDREHGRRWATVVRAAAIISGLHRASNTGAALASADLSPARLERFLNSEGDDLDSNFNAIVRFIRQKEKSLNLTDLALIYLWPESSEASDIRRSIAKSFYLRKSA